LPAAQAQRTAEIIAVVFVSRPTQCEIWPSACICTRLHQQGAPWFRARLVRFAGFDHTMADITSMPHEYESRVPTSSAPQESLRGDRAPPPGVESTCDTIKRSLPPEHAVSEPHARPSILVPLELTIMSSLARSDASCTVNLGIIDYISPRAREFDWA
jgi:hypothetical protein